MGLSWRERYELKAALREEWYRTMSDAIARETPVFDLLTRHEDDFAKSGDPRLPLVRELRMRLKGFGSGAPGSGRRSNFGTELQGLVPDSEAMLVQAGVASGRTSEGLKRAADLVGTQGRLMKTIGSEMAEPAMLIVAILGLVVFIATQVLPKVTKGKSREGLPGFASAYAWICDHVWWVAGGVGGLLIGAIVLVVYLAPRWTGPKREFADRHVFPFTLIASLNGASFLTSLGGFIAAGIPVKSALDSIRVCANPYMQWQCDQVSAQLRDGDRAEAALAKSTLLHVRYHWLVASYGMSGDPSEAFERIAKALIAATERFVKQIFAGIVGPVLKVFVAVFVIWTIGALGAMALNEGKPTKGVIGTAAPDYAFV